MTFQKSVRVEWSDRDRYDRILGHVFVDDRWINKALVEEGWAWHFKKYSADEDLAAAEVAARETQAGLWQDKSPIPPWDFRNAEDLAADSAAKTPQPLIPQVAPEPQPTSEPTVYVTNTGSKYHRGSCRHLKKSKIAISLSKAKQQYEPCKVCDPPQ